MAQKVQVLLMDDLDGGDADETVQFGLDGAAYEIDLSEKNAKKLRDSLAKYVGEARRASGRGSARRRSGRSARASGGTDAGTVRAWARANGHEVSDRGRVSGQVLAAYNAAH